MNKTIVALALPFISTLPSVSSSAAPADVSDWRPQITVQVYNAAGVTPSIILNAEHEADWIFGKASIRVNWKSSSEPPRVLLESFRIVGNGFS